MAPFTFYTSLIARHDVMIDVYSQIPPKITCLMYSLVVSLVVGGGGQDRSTMCC